MRFSCLLICFLAGWSFSAAAETLMKLPPEMELQRAQSDDGMKTENVAVSRIDSSQLPAPILTDVKAHVVSYSGDEKQLDQLIVYMWDAPSLHGTHLPPNYVVDYTAITPKPAADIAPCNDEGCLLTGYNFIGGAWKQDFELRSTSTQFARINENGSNYRVEIQTLSNRDICEKAGKPTAKGCLRRFLWRKYGLQALPAAN